MSKTGVYTLLAVILFVCVYSIAWLNISYEERRVIRNLISDAEARLNRRIYYNNMIASGFPLKLGVTIKNVRVKNYVNNGAYELALGDVTVDSDILLRKVRIAAPNKKIRSVSIDGELGIFSSIVEYQPKFEIGFNKSALRAVIKNEDLNSFLFSLDSLSYIDNGYKVINNDDGAILFSNDGNNSLFVDATASTNRHDGANLRDIHIIGAFDVRIGKFILGNKDGTFVENQDPLKHFKIMTDCEFRLSAQNADIYLNVPKFDYRDDDYQVSISGVGGYVSQFSGLVGEFKLDLTNYDQFFHKVIFDFFSDKGKFTLFKEKMLSIADSTDNGVMSLVYRADNMQDARLGKSSFKELALFMQQLSGKSMHEWLMMSQSKN